jgi:DNA-binding GntR family transcriptional regulator
MLREMSSGFPARTDRRQRRAPVRTSGPEVSIDGQRADLPRGGPLSLADRAYLRLRDQIITTEIPPGTLLQERELMHRLRVGRTPIREAIQQLRRDDFVAVLPRRGTIVTEVKLTDLLAIYEVRAHLESWEAGLAAERVTPAERLEATALMRELKALTEQHGFAAMLELDRRVHRFVYRCGKNAFLAETIDRYHDLSLRILYFAMARFSALTPRMHDVVRDQLQLLEAVVQGDAPRARDIAAAHVQNFEVAFRDVISPTANSRAPRGKAKPTVSSRAARSV